MTELLRSHRNTIVSDSGSDDKILLTLLVVSHISFESSPSE